MSNPDLQPSAVPGQTTGAMIMATGGLVWLLIGTQGIKGSFLIILPYLLLITAALMIQGKAKRLGIAPPPASESVGRDRILMRATIIEGIAIFAVIIGTQLVRHAEWIPPLIALVIGLHFIPIARAFQRPLFNATAAGLCLVAACVPLLVPLHGALLARAAVHSAWMLWCGIGSAAVLWTTSAATLARARQNLARHHPAL